MTLFVFAATVSATGCATPPDVDGRTSPMIFGDDDRLDWWEVDPPSRDFGLRHVGVLASRFAVGFRATPQDARIDLRNTRHRAGYCDDQPFLCQPRVGYCSGTLLDGDLFATAGHCLGIPTPVGELTADQRAELRERLEAWCEGAVVIFNWREEERDPARADLPPGETGGVVPTIVTERDVYYCHEVLVHQYVPLFGGTAKNASDITLFTLKRDRNAVTSQPVLEPYGAAPVVAEPRRPPSVALGTEVLGIGFGNGLPMKYKSAPLQRRDALWADAPVDVLQGDSGGGLFAGGRHFAVLSHAPFRCPPGSVRQGAQCRRPAEGDCIVDPQIPSPSMSDVASYSLTYRAIDVLCGGNGWFESTPEPPGRVFATRSAPYPSHLCGTAPPRASEPYVPSPPPVDPTPTPAPTPGPSTRAGCAAAGADLGAHATWPLLFAFIVWRRRRRGARLALPLLLAAMACGGGDSASSGDASTERDAERPDAGSSVDEGERTSHVVSFVRLPRRAHALGLDLNGDGTPDSAFGGLVELFADLDVSLTRPLIRAIEDGRLRLLVETERRGRDATVVFQPGLEGPLDPSGGGVYEASPDHAPTTFAGDATGDEGEIVARAPTFTLRFPILDETSPIELTLRDVRFEGRTSEDFLSGALGGGVRLDELRDGLFTPIAEFLDAWLDADPGCPGACDDPRLAALLAMIDTGADGRIDADELATFGPIADRLAADLDLDGDGTLDAMSLGVELEAVAATILSSRQATSGRAKSMMCLEPDDCERATSCAVCNGSDPAYRNCSWCPGTGCMANTRESECSTEWQSRLSSCIDCEAFTTPTACRRGDARCAWSETCGACVNDAFCATIPPACTDRRSARSCD
ncbi:MAG: hypothetical protein KF901_28065 [Myxococcales bacterium]|nr:hypothetical protein [Myxococcales bacterium]